MKTGRVLLFLCMTSVIPFAMAEPPSAKAQYLTVKAKQSANNYKVKSSKHAAQLVKGRYGGKVLSSKRSGKKGYRVKLLKSDGNIISVYVSAKTGKMKG